nr:paired amphipathic helix protein Sin3-like 3 isoform X1 [Tanacetum cinerariifolium]
MQLSFDAYAKKWHFDHEALHADLISRGMAVEDQSAPHEECISCSSANINSSESEARGVEDSEEKSIKDDIRQRIAPKRQNFIIHQEFKYSDLEIHEDLYELMKYSIKQSCSHEQIDEALKIWTTFMEPMLGVSRRPSHIDVQDAEKQAITLL